MLGLRALQGLVYEHILEIVAALLDDEISWDLDMVFLPRFLCASNMNPLFKW